MAFTWTPSYSSALSHEARLYRNRFGDGYEQRVKKGLNHLPQSWSLIFENISQSDADAIDDFLDANAGQAFDWTPPGKNSARFVCEEWERTFAAYQHYNITMIFTEDFAP